MALRAARLPKTNAARRRAGGPRRVQRTEGYLPLSLSLVGVELFDMLSLGEADVVPDDEDDGELGDMVLELDVVPDGVLLVADDVVDVSVELELDGGGLIVVVVLELDDGNVLGVVEVVVVVLEVVAGVVDGVVVVDVVLLVSR